MSSVENDSVPVYSSGNIVITKSNEQHYQRSHKTAGYLENQHGGTTWNGEILNELPVDANSCSATQILKRDYNKLQSFAYYGSCMELFRASLNHIVEAFPGEIFVEAFPSGGGIGIPHRDSTANGTPLSGTTSDGLVADCMCSNPFNIDIFATSVSKDLTLSNKLKYFANGGCRNYNVIRPDGSKYAIEEWNVINRSDKDCFIPGDIVCEVEIGAAVNDLGISTMEINKDFEVGLGHQDGNFMRVLIIKTDSGYGIFANEKYLGYHIRPNDACINEAYSKLSIFEQYLLNRETLPMYKATFEVIYETSTGYERGLEYFIFPTDISGYNLDIAGNQYDVYAGSLANLGILYDELYSDNLYRSMTHEAISNMDFTKIDENSETEYTLGVEKMKKVIRVLGRCFDEIKVYIDGIENVHTISYSNAAGTSDYSLSDELENDGWDIASVVALQKKNYYEHTGETFTEESTMPINDTDFIDKIIYYIGADNHQFEHGKFYRCTQDTSRIQITNTRSGSIDFVDGGIMKTLRTCLSKLTPAWKQYLPLTLKRSSGKWRLTMSNGTELMNADTIDEFKFGITQDMIVDTPITRYVFNITMFLWEESVPYAAGEKVYTDKEPFDVCTNLIVDSKGETHTLYREFSEVDAEYKPYGNESDAKFLTCCGGEVPANGQQLMTEIVKFIHYKGKKYILDCNDELRELVNGEVVTHPIVNGCIELRGETIPVQSEKRILHTVTSYFDNKTWTASEINYEFQKRLKLNSRAILRKKGTANAIESLLALWGMKSDRFVSNSTNTDLVSDYSIRETSIYTDAIKDTYKPTRELPTMDWYNYIKTYTYDTPNARMNIYDAYRGLPVTYVQYYIDPTDVSGEAYTTNAYDYKNTKRKEAFRMVYPYFDNTAEYDGGMYYQMYGGWLKKTPYCFGDKNLILCGETFTETLRNIHLVDNIEALKGLRYNSLYDGFVCEVRDNSIPYMNISGELLPVKTESVKFVNNGGILNERTILSYVEVPMYFDGFTVGNVTYSGDVKISNPCFEDFEEIIDLYDLPSERPTTKKIYLYYTKDGEKYPVDIYNLESGVTADMIHVDIEMDTDMGGDDPSVLMYAISEYLEPGQNYSNYWVLDDVDNYQSFAMSNNPYYQIGWTRLKENDPRALTLNSIKTITTGNNTHSARIPYDDGSEYLYRFVKLFKYPYMHRDFDERCF
jgi:hypothetical protein